MVQLNKMRAWADVENSTGELLIAHQAKTRSAERCRYWSAIAWALCIALAASNVYYTWCLHAKIARLEQRVDGARNDLLLDKSDLPFSGGIVGRPTSADEDQEMTEPDPLASLFGSSLKAEYDYDEQHVPGEDEDANEAPTRQKRQVDLTSHTQDGVPIFDQGYGISLNRTEGLRIYQSLLANGGAAAAAAAAAAAGRGAETGRVVESPPILPHHRENSFWRGRKDKARHHHQHGKLSAQPTVDLDESGFERNRTRGRQSSNVEFRSSRVKPSNIEAGSISSSMVQSDQKWARNSAISLGASPFANDERISAATAPAVLTKSASAVSAVTSGRSRSQHNVFKVTQPSSIPPLSPTPVPIENNRDDVTAKTSPMPPVKKRVNKKQLRDLNHAASAVHLVADTRNATDNQVEIASRNELGLHTSWKMGDESQKNSLVKIDGAILTVKQSGLYFIYSQVHYLDEHGVNAYEVFVNTEPFLRCVTSATPETSAPKPNTCYTAGASVLREGDKLFLRDIEPLRYSVLQPSKTFFGLIRLAPVSD